MQAQSPHSRITRKLGHGLLPLLLLLIACPGMAQTVDLNFSISVDGSVNALALQPDGSLIIGGYFNHIGLAPRSNIARVDAFGRLDPNFNPYVNGPVYGAVVQSDGYIWLGGGFFSNHSTGMPRALALLNPDGSVDAHFSTGISGTVHALALQPDGKLIVGGEFAFGETGDGPPVYRNNILRLNTDGSIDKSFDPNAFDDVYAIAIQADGKIVVAGRFNEIGYKTRNYIARLNYDGSVDPSFDPDANDIVDAIVVQPDQKILIGGYFTSLAPNGGAPTTHLRLARLNADGSADPTYTPSVDDAVYALALQPDGKLIVGGAFTQANNAPRSQLARLDSDGMLDSSFHVHIGNTLGGSDMVKAVALRGYGALLAGGDFNEVNDELQNRLVQLQGMGNAQQSLAIDSHSANGSVISWNRSGAGPELALPPQLLYSVDGDNYSVVGTMFRIDGGWRYTGLVLPLGTDFYLRVRGQVSSGEAGASGSLVETTRKFHLQGDEIFKNGFD